MTASTREDFEHAARAAGKHSQAWADPGQINDKGGLVQFIGLGRVETWNPRDDDGDALRLAVKLDISVFPPKVADGDFAVASIGDESGQMPDTWIQEKVICGDMLAATRHAIFRAAIAIGKAMLPPTTDNPTT